MKNIHYRTIVAILSVTYILNLVSCQKKQNTLFEKVEAQHSNIHFNNKITSTDVVNAFTFTNFYNGGGVGIGDFNKDGLQDVFFTGNQESCRLYINKGDFKFEDITQAAGVSTDRWCTGVCVADVNQDGWDDIYISVASHPTFKNTRNLLFINQKTASPTFKEEAHLYGLDYEGFTTQTVFFDYDLDGDLDAYMLNTAPDVQNPNVLRPAINNGTYPSTDKLFRNEGLKEGHFTYKDVSKEAGIVYEGLGLGVVVSDVNNDGWPDIYGSNDFMSSDVFYLNQGNGTFKNIIKQAMPHTSMFGMGIDAADIDNDGAVDLFQLDMMPEDNERQKQMLGKQDYDKKEMSLTPQYGYQLQYMRNMLQLNRGNVDGIPQFSDVGLLAGVAKTDWSWSTLMADLDNDCRKDIFITTGYRKNITDLDFVSYNQNSNFFGSDANKNESREKLLAQVPEIKLHNYAYRNTGVLQFENVSQKWGLDELSYANGAAYADLDNDGDLDLIVNNIDEEASIFKNKTRETTSPNFLKIKFKGDSNNIAGIGAKVTVWTQDTMQIFENQPIRGYLSSMPQGVFAGLGQHAQIDSLKIEWPKGLKQTLYNVATNQSLTVDIKNAQLIENGKTNINTLFKTLPDLIPYVHQESDFNDFKQIAALHKMFSKFGAAATGDLNGDKLTDVIVGGAYRGSPNMLYFQQKNGSFSPQKRFESPEMEIGDFAIFDADGDKDNDILVVGGSNEHPLSIAASYQPILYLNNGKGQFSPSTNMPNMAVSSQTIKTFDFDNDGDLDVFIGGTQTPNQYPMPANSYILKNEKGVFTDITAQIAPFLNKIGMVCDAMPIDIDNDKDMDLVLTGMWMPLTILENKNAQFELKTMPNTEGWWSCINVADFDNDGDLDLLLGNEGLNTFYHASASEPISMYAKDFNQDGQIDPIMGYFIKGKNSPALPRENLNQQIVQFRKKYTRYANYAKAGFDDLFSEKEKKDAYQLKAVEMRSCYAENKSNGQFELKTLPIQAQMSPISQFLIADFDKDGYLDAVISGNFYPNEAHMGRQDASRGLFLKGKGNGQFDAINNTTSGLNISGDARRSYFIEPSKRFFTFINSGKIVAHELK